MVHTRPRFGGGKIMENANFLKKLEQGVPVTKTMEHRPSKHHHLKRQAMAPEQPDEMENNGTNKQECRAEVSQDMKCHVDGDTNEEEPGSFQRLPNFIFLSESSKVHSDRLLRNGHSSHLHTAGETSSSAGKYVASRDKESCPPNETAFSIQADRADQQLDRYNEKVSHLMSIFKSLGINVALKKYVRTSVINNGINAKLSQDNSGELHFSPIDLSNVPTFDDESSPTTVKKVPSNSDLFCKNLFLKDRKGQYFLVMAEESADVDLKRLKQQLKASRNLSFADTSTTVTKLGVRSGEINPFVVMFESASDVRFIMHESLCETRNSKTRLAFHPLDGRLQVDLTVNELIKFFHHYGKHLEFLSEEFAMELQCVKKPLQDVSSSDLDNGSINMGRWPTTNGEEIDHNERREDSTRDARGGEDAKEKPSEILSEQLVIDEKAQVEEKPNDVMIKRKTESFETIILTKEQHALRSSNANRANIIPNWMINGRKGKLKSFLKKKAKTPVHSSSSSDTPHTLVENQTENVSELESHSEKYQMPALHDSTNETINQKKKDKSDISKTLPEITNFYVSLSKLCIQYREEDLQSCTTIDIGPSLGCKCVLLKDKKQNYFFVITHEFYELDYGRLKKTLKPRKKLMEVETAEVLDNLGVQPHKITPFSCVTERAKSREVKVFITEKIQPSEIILCIQHPYAEGLRFVMSSGELQRYLSEFIHQIETVQEKVWGPKYNRIFTQFSDKNKSDSMEKDSGHMSSADLHLKESHPSHGAATGPLNADDKNESDGKEDQHTDAEGFDNTTKMGSSLFNISKVFLQKCVQYCFTSPLTAIYQKDSKDNVKFVTQALDGSSVDPPSLVKAEESHDLSGEVNDQIVNTEAQYILDEISNDKLTVSDIVNHLKETGVSFSSNIPVNGNFKKKHHRGGHNETRSSTRKVDSKFAGDISSEAKDMMVEGVNNGEEMGDNLDNTETCTTTYLTDGHEKHYIIVGGESDFITTRRFRRRFHLSGRLQMCEMTDSHLLTSPFSVVLALKAVERQEKSMAKVYVVLFTSIFIDSDTVCTFRLDGEGSTIRMSSSQFQQYASEAGMEVWCMP